MNNGTCGNCGGRVSTPTVWYGIHPPTPRCDSCGAIPKNPHGPVIEMQPPQRPAVTTTGALPELGYKDGEPVLLSGYQLHGS